MSALIVIGLAGVGTLALRGSFLALFGDRTVPPMLSRALRFVPAAVLTAITVPAVTHAGGELDLTSPRVPAAVLAAIVAWRTRSIAWTIVVGLVAQWLIGQLV